MDQDLFEPRLGTIRAPASRRGNRYVGRVLASAALPAKRRSRDRIISRQRVGGGTGLGRLLADSRRSAGFRSRRAIVKTRFVRLSARAIGAACAHLRYIQRDGSPGILYSSDHDHAEGRAFIERCPGDRPGRK